MPDDGAWGDMYTNGSWSGLVGQLQRQVQNRKCKTGNIYIYISSETTIEMTIDVSFKTLQTSIETHIVIVQCTGYGISVKTEDVGRTGDVVRQFNTCPSKTSK